jgi:hypothetical protein
LAQTTALGLQRAAGNAAVSAHLARTRTSVTPAGRTAVQRGLFDTIAGGVASLAGGVRDRVLGQLGTWARRIPGYGLLCVVLGRDPIAGTDVPRTATNLVGGFMSLIPGGMAIFENLQRAGAVDRAFAWFESEVPRLGLTFDAIVGLFRRAWEAIGIGDLLDLGGLWDKVAGVFGPPLTRLKDFALAAAGKVLEFVFEGVLSLAGSMGGQIMGIIRRAGNVLGTIVRNPIGFAGNLISAVRGGLGRFLSNIWSHLRTGLFSWLTGALRGAVSLPQRFDLPGIITMVLGILGLTWAALRTRLVALIGEPVVSAIETAIDWIDRIRTGGLGAIAERIAEFASGLVDTVIGGIRDWVARSVVGAAITKLVTMFNPAGAIIQSIIAVYNTIQFFIERAQQLAALAGSLFESIAAIATGNLGNAIAAVENAMARTLPVVLGFLARLIGLGDIASPVRNVINRARAVIDPALDRVTTWIAGMGRQLMGRLRGQGARREEPRTATPEPAQVQPNEIGNTTFTSGGRRPVNGAIKWSQALIGVIAAIRKPTAPARPPPNSPSAATFRKARASLAT